jgi:hypothetical protein
MSICRIDAPVIYQHPLAYLLGLEGVALLRAFSGVYDRDFTSARFREIRTLLNSVEELGGGVEVRPIATREGYAHCFVLRRARQSTPRSGTPVVREILDSLLLGVALDALAAPAATPHTWRRSATR